MNTVAPPSVALELSASDDGGGGGGGPNRFAVAALVVFNLLAFGTAALRFLVRQPTTPQGGA